MSLYLSKYKSMATVKKIILKIITYPKSEETDMTRI